jgi:hypothetical protein
VAVDYFIDIDGIPGESEDAGHKDKIPVLSFSRGETQPGTFGNGTGGTAGKVSFSDFRFTMQTCKATPKLMQACASGKHIEKGGDPVLPEVNRRWRSAGLHDPDHEAANRGQLSYWRLRGRGNSG